MRRSTATGPAPTASAARLDLARGSLADSRLLANRQSRNASMLLDLALRQALSAIILTQGLDAPDGLDLDTLLRRVPSGHAASALASRLADPRSRDAATVEQLIDAVSALDDPAQDEAQDATPPPARRARPAAQKPEPAGQTRTRAKPHRRVPDQPATDQAIPDKADPPDIAALTAEGPSAEAATGPRGGTLADGPTAFETTVRRPSGRSVADGDSPRAVASAAFWALAERWRLSDTEALALLGSGRGLTAKGTRPRFSLRDAEARRYGLLHRIDTAIDVLGETPDWLRRPQRKAPFDGRTPLASLLEQPDLAETILHYLDRTGLRAALEAGMTKSTRGRAGGR